MPKRQRDICEDAFLEKQLLLMPAFGDLLKFMRALQKTGRMQICSQERFVKSSSRLSAFPHGNKCC